MGKIYNFYKPLCFCINSRIDCICKVTIAIGPSRQTHAKVNFLANRVNNCTAIGIHQKQVVVAK